MRDKRNFPHKHSEETSKKKVWFLIGGLPTFAVMSIALFAPLDILDRVPILADFLQIFARHIPSLAGYVSLSAYSQVTAAFFVSSWVLLPLQTIVWFYVVYRYADFGVFSRGETAFGQLKMTLSAILLGVCIFVVLFWVPKEWSVAGSWGMNKSRLGLAFFGAGGFLFMAISVSFSANSVIDFIFGEANG